MGRLVSDLELSKELTGCQTGELMERPTQCSEEKEKEGGGSHHSSSSADRMGSVFCPLGLRVMALR